MQRLASSSKDALVLVQIRPNPRSSGEFCAWKTCGKPVGQALKAEQARAQNCECFGAQSLAPNRSLNNRGQLARFRQLFHRFSDTINCTLELINRSLIIVYNIPTPGCPRGTPSLNITMSLTLKGLVNKATPLLNPTNP